MADIQSGTAEIRRGKERKVEDVRRKETTGEKIMSASATQSGHNKAIVDYTSPVVCTPVIPFPPIGDAAYRQHAGG